jgi:hypothetical protein
MDLFIPQVAAAIKPEMTAVWDSLGPDYSLKSLETNREETSAFADPANLPRDTARWQGARMVFDRKVADGLYDAISGQFRREAALFPSDDYGCQRFIITHRWAHRTGITPTSVYANRVLPFATGLTKEFWAIAAPIPKSIKRDLRLYLELFRRHFPEALSVPFCTEKGLFSARRPDPLVWAMTAIGRMQYYRDRLQQVPPVARLRRLVAKTNAGQPGLLQRVIQRVNLDDPNLNADAVRKLQTEGIPSDRVGRAGVHLLFYRQMWQWILSRPGLHMCLDGKLS